MTQVKDWTLEITFGADLTKYFQKFSFAEFYVFCTVLVAYFYISALADECNR